MKKSAGKAAVCQQKGCANRRTCVTNGAADHQIINAKLSTERKKEKKPRKKKRRTKAKHPTAKKPTTEKDTKETSPADFNDWVSHPPSEFSELFAAADTALASFDATLEKGKQMTKHAIAMTSSLDEFAEATADEAKRLAKAAQRAIDTSKKADLN